MKKQIAIAVTATVALSLTLSASLIPFQSGASLVDGTTLGPAATYNGWDELNRGRITDTTPYGDIGVTDPWESSIVANLGSNDASLFKSSGLGYVAGGSIYQGIGGPFGPGGVFQVDGQAIAGLETIVFQVAASINGFNDVFTVLPLLNIGGNALQADFSSLFWRGAVGDDTHERWAFQWDLTGLSIAENEAFSVEWTGVAHSGIFELQLNQGDTMAQVVPEPAHFALFAGAALLFCILRRRIRRSLR